MTTRKGDPNPADADRPSPRLFHLHVNTPDVEAFETALARFGLPLRRRFGFVDGALVALDPGEAAPRGWRFHLETAQRGYVNVTVGRGRRFRFDHFGVYAAAFETLLERAAAAGWPVREPDGRRPFAATPWGFRIECHPEGDAVEGELGEWSRAHLSDLALVAPDGAAVRDGIERVVGPVPGLRVRSGPVERPAVDSFSVEGEAFPGGATFDVRALAAATR